MKILAATDFHGYADSFQKIALMAEQKSVDVVVLAGDITNFGTVPIAKKFLSEFSDIEAPVLFIPGNCDMPSLAGEELKNVKSIHGRCVSLKNFGFLGVGGSSTSPFNTPFELTEMEISELLNRGGNLCEILHKIILITHSPPKNTNVDVTYRGVHAGSFAVREFIERRKPLLVLCGHIHEAVGIDRIGDSLIINPGPARHRKYALITINRKIDVELSSY